MSKKLNRDTALSARPEKVPPTHTEERENGGMVVTVKLARRRLFRWLGAEGEVESNFGLDPLGREIYEACDGKSTVTAIIRRFARSRHLSLPEAEIAVTTFLKTLMTKGLVVMAIEKKRVTGQR